MFCRLGSLLDRRPVAVLAGRPAVLGSQPQAQVREELFACPVDPPVGGVGSEALPFITFEAERLDRFVGLDPVLGLAQSFLPILDCRTQVLLHIVLGRRDDRAQEAARRFALG